MKSSHHVENDSGICIPEQTSRLWLPLLTAYDHCIRGSNYSLRMVDWDWVARDKAIGLSTTYPKRTQYHLKDTTQDEVNSATSN